MSDPTICHYSALGLTKDATLSDIKKAFRKLALEFHPDKVQGEAAKEASSKKFQRVNEAYGILSDEDKRQEYDDRVKLAELRKRAKAEANISVPRTPTAQHYDVRYAEPRPDTFARAKSTSRTTTSSSTSSKFYPQYPPSASRSYEEDIYTARHHYDDTPRTARRQPSYDEKPSKREEERERERRHDIRAAERAAAERAAERKEKERRVDKDSKKAKEKQRKREGEEKRSHREPAYHDDDSSGPRVSSKSDKKKSSSSSKKHDDRDKREKSIPREIVREEVAFPDKSAHFLMTAAHYINASRSKATNGSNPPPLSRSSTFQDYTRYASPPAAAPTPPVAQEAPFPPPPDISVEEETDDEPPRRSSAKPSVRRSSETPKVRERERSSHKKSGSGSREYVESPPVVIPGHPRLVPQFAKGSSTPPKVPDSPPRSAKISRAQTMREAEFARVVPPPQPPLSRSSTYHYGESESREPRGRDRSRFQAQQVLSEEDSDSDGRRYESRRADRRHRTRSPDFVDDYPPPPPPRTSTRYSVKTDGRIPVTSEPIYSYYPEGASPPSSRKSKTAAYYEPYSRAPEARPPMTSRGSGYSSSGGYVPSRVKLAQSYTHDDVQYSHMPYQEAAYGC